MKGPWLAVLLDDPLTDGRFVLCRRDRRGWTTAECSFGVRWVAEREQRRLQARFDFEAARPPVDPDAPRQLILGFYGPEQE